MRITQELLDDLTAKAKSSPRLRMNLDLRNSAADGSQRMLNALEPGTPLPIHRHTNSSETVVCLRGRLLEEFYDELEMTCTESIELSPNGPVVALNIPIGQWHTVRVLESGTVILECKDGAYEPIGPEDILEVGLVGWLKSFLENEARSCSIDPACVTPEYVCRMLGGTMAPEDIAEALEKAKGLLK